MDHYLHQFFEYKAKTHPNHAAVIYEGREFSYSYIDHRSNCLAAHLKSLGVKPRQYVAILFERNDLAYIAMLAVLKLGAAYVPLDPEFPPERIKYILQDCGASLIITSQQLSQAHHFPCPTCIYDQALIAAIGEGGQPDSEWRDGSLADTCYVIYTSGSTGKPKGVEISHQSVGNYLREINKIYDLTMKDRIYQGFSLAFDASVEEIWGAFSAGATLVATNNKALRSGAGLIEFLDSHQVSVFSTVPTLLDMLEPQAKSLRVLVLGGEVCRADLIKRWSRSGLRIFNTYGPTEATVVTTYCECHPEQSITLGRPLTNCEVCILNDDLQPVDDNQEGELCIAGAGLSRGYINRPDLNESKFIFHPAFDNKRFYRTGDLCRKLENGEIQFLGRIDGQIKLRGYRIELAEIETVIREYPEVRQAVVSLWEASPGVEFLTAYIIPENPRTFLKENIVGFLRQHLAAYMVPNFFEIIEEIPLLASGKIDRKMLPPPQADNPYTHTTANYKAPQTDVEQEITKVWENLFNKNSISVDNHFFYDLGGHSLLAAKAASMLRQDSHFSQVSILDIYKNPTIEKLAAQIESIKIEDPVESKVAAQDIPTWQYYLSGFMQLFGVYGQLLITSLVFLTIVLALNYPYHSSAAMPGAMIFSMLGILIASPILLMIFAVVMKWLLLGRVKAGTYPLWGSFYLRWWFIQRLQYTVFSLAPLIGSPLINIYCRLMGAKIGKNCFINTKYIHTFDLLTLDDDSSINNDAVLAGYIIADGNLKIGAITIGKRCFIGVRSVLSINTIMENDSSLEDLSMLPENCKISQDQSYFGSPARLHENQKNQSKPELVLHDSFWQNFKYGFLHYLGLLLIASIYLLAFVPGLVIMDHFMNNGHIFSAILLGTPIASVLFIAILYSEIIIAKKLLTGNIAPGCYPIKSGFYIRKWLVEHLINLPEVDLLSESLFFTSFLKALGMKSGKRVEMAEAPYLTPELLTIKDEGFTASAVIINAPRVYLGKATYSPTVIGKRTFIGSSAVLSPNTELGDKCLLGSLTLSPARSVLTRTNNSAWLGSPPVFLPKREIASGFPEELTFNPGKSLYLVRGLIESIRVVLPICFSYWFIFFMIEAMSYLINQYSVSLVAVTFPLLEMAILFVLALANIGLKWLLIGRYHPDKKPLWHIFIWKRDLLEHLHNYFLVRFIFEPILGTPFIGFFLRLLGVKIGKRVHIDTTGFAEHDLIDIGDNVSLNIKSTLLTHLYEDRIFKMDKIKIAKGCCVGASTIVTYDTVMAENASIGNLSLLMKGEHLPTNSHWEGIPSQPKKTASN